MSEHSEIQNPEPKNSDQIPDVSLSNNSEQEPQQDNINTNEQPTINNAHEMILEKVQSLNLENYTLKQEKNDLVGKLNDLEKSCQAFKVKADRSAKQIESIRSELQSMVIKYATSEKEVIEVKKRFDDVDRRYKDLLKEKDHLHAKTKELTNEKNQLLNNLERQILESASLKNKNEILKNKLDQSDLNIQRLQLKFNDVNTRYEYSKNKLEEIECAMQKLNLVNENSNDEKETTEDSSVNPEESTIEETDVQNSNNTEKTNNKWIDLYLNCVHSNQTLAIKVESLEHEIQKYKQEIVDLNIKLTKAKDQMKDYLQKLDLIDSLKNELVNRQNVINDLKDKFDKVNEINRDLLSDANSSKHKESELLEYTERLTAKMVSLQSEHNMLNEKLKNMEADCERNRSDHDVITMENNDLKTELSTFKEQKANEIKELQQQLVEKTKDLETFKRKNEELENDVNIMKRKHILNLKELNKEIQTLKKFQQNQQNKKPENNHLKTSQQQFCETNSIHSTLSSRTNSLTSLTEMIEPSSQHFNHQKSKHPQDLNINYNNNNDNNEASSISSISDQSASLCNNINNNVDNQQSSPPASSSSSHSNNNEQLLTSLNDIDKNTLIERILRLQRQLIKRNEKIDFLEEHNGQLVEEVKKKSKLLQYYILKEETGALATESMDKNKAYLSKRGVGIMSSLYNSSPTDDTMTLERSLEINNKLHAILEDTLLKNMTLKENLNTLAMEIDRLSKDLNQYQQQNRK